MLDIYSAPDPDFKLVTLGGVGPIKFTLDAMRGGALCKRFYVRNDNSSCYYTSVVVSPSSPAAPWVIDGTIGWSLRLLAGHAEPFPEQWIVTPPATQISLSDIGDSTTGDVHTFFPFWVRVEIPRDVQALTTDAVYLHVSAKEWLI